MILRVTVLMLVACATDLALRRAPAALRHLMWTLSLIGALVIPLGAFYAPRIGGAFVIHATAGAATFLTDTLEMPARFNLMMAIYVFGMALFLVRLVFDILAANRLVRESRSSSLPGVLINDQATVPFAWGSIVIPSGFETRNAVLAHEAAHLERRDVWTSLLARVVCAVYWFHPLVWWANFRMRLEADRACDDAVLRNGFAGASYAEELVEVARSFGPVGLAPGAVNRSQLEVRVRHILSAGVNRRRLGTAAVCAAVLGCIAIVSPLAAITQRTNDPKEAIFKVGNGTRAPRVLFKIDPEYTEAARAAKLQGTVLLAVVIGSDGVARDIQVTRTVGLGLEAKAAEAVRKWKFQPGTRDGRPVSVRAMIEVNFRLL